MLAVFQLRKVYGSKRYYPKNLLAGQFVGLKRTMVQNCRKKTVKCLAEREIKILKKMGISLEIRTEIK